MLRYAAIAAAWVAVFGSYLWVYKAGGDAREDKIFSKIEKDHNAHLTESQKQLLEEIAQSQAMLRDLAKIDDDSVLGITGRTHIDSLRREQIARKPESP